MPEGTKRAFSNISSHFKPFKYVKDCRMGELVSGYPSLWNKGWEFQEDGFLPHYKEHSELEPTQEGMCQRVFKSETRG